MRNYPNAGGGLRKIYLAAIASIICTFVMIVPVVEFFGAIGVIVCSIVTMIGFYQAGKDIEGCKIAFALQIIALVIGILDIFMELPTVINIVGEFLPLIAICMMCWSVSQVMKELGAEKVAKQGIVAMFVYIGCEVAMLLMPVFMLVILLNGGILLYLLLMIVIAILELVFYLKFLKNAAEQLGSY